MVNVQTEAVFGYTRENLLGQQEILVPERVTAMHPVHRTDYSVSPGRARWVRTSSWPAAGPTGPSSRRRSA
jgi:hypothetical protein